ncbi:MAG: hypothetical protein VB060_06865 [Oscillibacter sp.]|nr:hypothetical protein [Oscillibacter sp.]MEA4993536.1 hypothetical protein [Oscillibacter sp.]
MNSKLIAAALAAVLCLSLAACGQTPASGSASEAAGSAQTLAGTSLDKSGEPRTITDLGGHQVTVPAAADIEKIGDFQKKGIEGLAIPAVDFLMKGVNSPETMSVAWDGQIRELLGTDTSVGIQQEWDATNAKLDKLLEQVGNEKKTGLCIKLNQAGSLMVMGSDSFDGWAQSFFALSGIENAAASIEGTREVSMEQIYQWDPDFIMCFQDAPASYILENTIEGQDRPGAHQCTKASGAGRAGITFGFLQSNPPAEAHSRRGSRAKHRLHSQHPLSKPRPAYCAAVLSAGRGGLYYRRDKPGDDGCQHSEIFRRGFSLR